ncbi:MAG: hypothetical protein ACH37Z_12205 [Anaerolineae bacterium]
MEPGSIAVAGLGLIGGALAGYFQRGKSEAEAEPATVEAFNRRLTIVLRRVEKLELAVEVRDQRIDALQEQLAAERRECDERVAELRSEIDKLRRELTR